MAKTIEQKRSELEKAGFVVGKRDPRINTDYPGRFMVVEEHEESDLPTRDGSNGPWCIVGNDLNKLVEDAYDNATCFEPE